MMKMTMPEAITIRQNAKPSDFWLVAGLLRLPSMLMPRDDHGECECDEAVGRAE